MTDIEGFIEETPYSQYNARERIKNYYLKNSLYLIKSSLGVGIFSISKSFRDGGIIFTSLLLPLIGIFCTYCLHLLVNASEVVCNKSKMVKMSYSETAEHVFLFGPRKLRKFSIYFRYFVDISILLTYISSIMLYINIINLNVFDACKNLKENFDWRVLIFIITGSAVLLLCQIKQYKNLPIFSYTATTFLIKIIIILFYKFIYVLIKDEPKEKKIFLEDFTNIPSIISVIMFSIEGVGAVLTTENNMPNDKFTNWFGVLNISMFSITSCFFIIGLLGYMAFGVETKDIILDNIEIKDFFSMLFKLSIGCSLLFSIPLQFYIVIGIISRYYDPIIEHKKNYNIISIAIRSSLILVIIFLSIITENHIGYFIDIVGSIFFSMLGVIIPCILNIIINYNNWGLYYIKLIKDILIIIIAFVLMINVLIFSNNNIKLINEVPSDNTTEIFFLLPPVN